MGQALEPAPGLSSLTSEASSNFLGCCTDGTGICGAALVCLCQKDRGSLQAAFPALFPTPTHPKPKQTFTEELSYWLDRDTDSWGSINS